ncbi:MAG TPA: hypothetical protein VFD13_02215, partial [Candidatus Kapabacteria bacterium]|nr:hypothetical protein [Candidatus Kapabacteria bacterium]
MLNYIWLGLIVIAIFVALGRDVSEEATNRFRNNEDLTLHIAPETMKVAGPNHYTGTAYLTKAELSRFYGADEAKPIKGDTVFFAADIVQSQSNAKSGALTLTLPTNAPPIMVDAAAANGDATKIIGKAAFDTSGFAAGTNVSFLPPTVHFRILAKVADEGILKIANVAVELAIGLIGVMALWLGIMKIAEAAGLVLLLAKIVKPIMVRVFPDVPPDHP